MKKEDGFDIKKYALASGEELRPAIYPNLDNLSAAFIFPFVPRPRKLERPEFVYIPIPPEKYSGGEYSAKAFLTITEWNALWEAGQLRPVFFPSYRDFPKELIWLKEYQNSNLYLIPDGPNKNYDAFAPLYHLVPYRTLLQYSLPAFTNLLIII